MECQLVLEVYEDDGETVAWEVGTSSDHANPYLSLPENYAAQEIDFIAGAATIGQVEVIVVDKAQTVGDQDSGWMTQRLSSGGIPTVRGRRCRLRRFISDALGYVTIIDGPAGTPRLHESFAGFRWVIKDTRENERKFRAFVSTDVWVLPMGLEDGWGQYEDGGVQWLVPPTDPLTGTYRDDASDGKGRVTFEDYWQDAFTTGGLGNRFPSSEFVSDRAVEIATGLLDLVRISPTALSPQGWRWTWSDFEVLWRLAGSGDPWTVVNTIDTAPGLPDTEPSNRSMVNWVGANGEFGFAGVPHAEYEGIRINAAYSLLIRGYQAAPSSGSPTLQDGTYPTNGQSIEVALRYVGEPTEAAPLFLEFDDDGVTRLTTGRFLKKLYDGEFSERDEAGDPIPTGIRYDEDALLEMTDPVRAMITGPVDDLRAVTEAEIYAPTGWAPALDLDMMISPVSQVPPDSFDELPEVNNQNTVPEPNWDAGEFIINFLQFTYSRAYVEVGQAASIIGNLALRDVVFTYQSESSVDNEEPATFQTRFFVAVGNEDGGRIGSEYGAQLAEDRRLYVFDRYNYGAPTIQVPVRRTESAEWKPGEWVVVDITWIPDYILQRRGALWGGQVMSIQDLNCAWRVMLIEEVLPLERPDES